LWTALRTRTQGYTNHARETVTDRLKDKLLLFLAGLGIVSYFVSS